MARTPSSRRRRPRQAPGRLERAPARRAAGDPTVSTTIRLRGSLRRQLEEWAARRRRPLGEVAQDLLEEALRMRQCPGIYFADEPSGRVAKIGGTGLAVWEVLRDFVADEDASRLRAAFPQLSGVQRTAAVLYFRRYPVEVRGEVNANAALTREAIERQYPGLVRSITVA